VDFGHGTVHSKHFPTVAMIDGIFVNTMQPRVVMQFWDMLTTLCRADTKIPSSTVVFTVRLIDDR